MKYKTQYVPCCEEELEKALNSPPESRCSAQSIINIGGSEYIKSTHYKWVLNSWEPYSLGFIIVWEEVSY